MDAVVSIDEYQNIVVFNPAAEKIFGYREEEILGQPLNKLIPARFQIQHRQDVQQFKKEGIMARSMNSLGELTGVRSNGQEFPFEASISKIEIEGKSIFTAILRDISERKRMERELRENEARLKEMFENLDSGVAIYSVSSDGQDFFFSGFNRAAERIDQILRGDLIGKNLKEVFPSVTEFGLLEVLKRVWVTGKAEHFPASFYADGRIAGWRDNYVYKLASGEVVAIYNDLTKEKQAEEKMRRLAHYDQLTDLPNRTLLADRIQQMLATAKREKQVAALLFIDLDKFKPVNDEFGHDAGDLLLKAVANRLRSCVRESDTISRIGGDEFIILLPNLEVESAALHVAEKILHAVSQPYVLLDHNIEISASIGVALYPEDGNNEKNLIKHADDAMYRAKEQGKNCIASYSSHRT